MNKLLPGWVVLHSINLILWSWMLRVSLRLCHGSKERATCQSFRLLFVCFPLLQWHKLIVSGKKVIASDSGSIIWCSQIFWLSDSSLKCASMLKNYSGNGIVRFCAYHLQIISISGVLCEQRKRHLIFFLSVSPCENNLNLKFTWGSFLLSCDCQQ